MRLSALVKSDLSKTVKWLCGEGHFCIKVPAAGAKEITRYLNAVKEPMATYHSRDGVLVARQWRLPTREHRAIRNFNSPELSE